MAFTYFHVNFHLVLIESFKYGINTGLRHWRTALIGYVFQLLLVFTVGMQIYQVFEASIGNSLGINELMDGFDDTVVSDFIQVHGASLSPLLGQLRYLFLVYLVFSVFINAGLLFAVSEEKPGWVSFWEGGKKYFLHFCAGANISIIGGDLVSIYPGAIPCIYATFHRRFFIRKSNCLFIICGFVCLAAGADLFIQCIRSSTIENNGSR